MNDRSVSLAELAARAQSQGPAGGARSRSSCRNPECQNGLTPGLIASGGGTKGAPIFGAGGTGAKNLMRWGWTPCPACNKSAKGSYHPLNLSEDQIAQRAQMATAKSPHRIEPPRREATAVARPATPSADSGKLTELLETNKKLSDQVTQLTQQLTAQSAQFLQINENMSRMTMQVASLLEDNAKLRRELEEKSKAAS